MSARATPAALDARRGAGRLAAGAPFDLLDVAWLGSFLRWRGARLALQLPLFLLAVLMIAHGFWGPELAPKNLAPLLTWVHFRGAVVLVLLVAGNLFCMACPFLVPRSIARVFHTPRRAWPGRLRRKWLAIAAFVGVLFVYELFDLWSATGWTAALVAGYFAVAFGVDLCFERASFCKYLCPVGQFNFLASTLSPLEVSARDASVCERCQTHDCLRGRYEAGDGPGAEPRLVQRGCELKLFVPSKVDNLDCTFCLDCIHACPHDNVGIRARVPGEGLARAGPHPGVGNLDQRLDFSALTVVFVFGALLNAFAMTSPVYALEQAAAELSGLTVEWPLLAALFALVLVAEPVLLLGGAALLTRRAGVGLRPLEIVHRFARCLVPIGFGVWLAHYGFHFFTGLLTVVPVAQNAALDSFGRPLLGAPLWRLGGLPEAYVFPLELGFLGLGLLGSLGVAWQIATRLAPARRARVFAPWAGLSAAVAASACWVLAQPMDMRGTFLGG